MGLTTSRIRWSNMAWCIITFITPRNHTSCLCHTIPFSNDTTKTAVKRDVFWNKIFLGILILSTCKEKFVWTYIRRKSKISGDNGDAPDAIRRTRPPNLACILVSFTLIWWTQVLCHTFLSPPSWWTRYHNVSILEIHVAHVSEFASYFSVENDHVIEESLRFWCPIHSCCVRKPFCPLSKNHQDSSSTWILGIIILVNIFIVSLISVMP